MLFAVLKKLELPKTLKSLDGFELRLDYLETLNIDAVKAFIEVSPLPVLLTLRKASQGGQFEGSEEVREALIEKLMASKPAFFDLEYDVDLAFALKMKKSFPDVKLICSYHDFDKTPDDLDALFEKVQAFPAFAYKIATFADSILDALRMLIFAWKHKNVIGLCMGEKGSVTRILGPVVGNPINYVSLGDLTAPGQLELGELIETYRSHSLSSETKIYGLIGDPVNLSIGHIAHNAVMEKYQLPAVYVKMEVKTAELPDFFSLVKQLPFGGLSVTMPHKEAVLPYLDENRSEVPAVNTIVIENGRLIGFNTDGIGALDALERKLPVKGKRILLLGAGGATQAIAHAAMKRGGEVVVLNRTGEKAKKLFQERGGGFERLEEEYMKGYDVLINTTSSAMPIDPKWILNGAVVMDIISVPRTTPFLSASQEKGSAVVYGIEMFVYQAAAQDKLWFGPCVDDAAIHSQLYELFAL